MSIVYEELGITVVFKAGETRPWKIKTINPHGIGSFKEGAYATFKQFQDAIIIHCGLPYSTGEKAAL